MTNGNGADWAREYEAASLVTDLARDPDDFRVTRQSAVTAGGVLVPFREEDQGQLTALFAAYEYVFALYRQGDGGRARGVTILTGMMRKMIEHAAGRASEPPSAFEYISLDPRDYTIFKAPRVETPVISIHTRPERCWFLAVLRFPGFALGESLGRMRVMAPTEQGVYPVTIRTKWRGLTISRQPTQSNAATNQGRPLHRPTCLV